MKYIAMVLVALALAVSAVLPASAEVYKKERNYMSAVGYARWQEFLKSGEWKSIHSFR